MTGQVRIGDRDVPIVSRTSGRARRITLRVSAADGRVTLTRPVHVTEAAALDFARSRADWLDARLAGRPAPVVVAPGLTIPVEGVPTRVVVAGAASDVGLRGGVLGVTARRPGRDAERVLRERAMSRLTALCDGHAASLGRPAPRIVLRDPRSRWGSCSSAGRLMFSWRLILAPAEVLDYVAAHEAAHLAHMHHGPAFWAEVARLRPGHEPARRWLRDRGAGLHLYDFSDGVG